jgi:Kdo2-lipid IVA lauroyltransferase/acyltransferase
LAKHSLKRRMRRAFEQRPALGRAVWLAEAAAVGLFWFVCARLSPERAGALGRRMLQAIGPRLARNAVIRRNLEIAFRDRSPAEIRSFERQIWGNLGTVLAEYPHLATICEAGAGRLEAVLDPEVDPERPIVFAGPHIANWEVSAAAPLLLGLPMTVAYTPLSNPYVDRWLLAHRQKLGCRLLPRDRSAFALVKALKRGEAIGIVVDHRNNEGVPLPFFGYDKLTTLSPAWLALKTGAQLVPGRIERLGPARYRVIAEAPVLPEVGEADTDRRAARMMAELNARFEAAIREQPGNWSCTKRSWPRKLEPRPAARPAAQEMALEGPLT